MHLYLTKWRIEKNLDIDLLKKQKILILGTGTLAHSITNTLLGYNVNNFTFVDHN